MKNASGDQKAKQLYDVHCAGCHDMGAGGALKFGVASQWQDRLDSQGEEGLIYNAIHGYGNMPAMGGCYECSEDDIALIVKYMLGAINQILQIQIVLWGRNQIV